MIYISTLDRKPPTSPNISEFDLLDEKENKRNKKFNKKIIKK
jgi:hypothetical protein